MRRPSPAWRPRLLVLLPLAFGLPAAPATWQDDIGFTQLRSLLGPAMPIGAGVSATHVEAVASANGEYLPSAITNPTSGNFSLKTFAFQSGISGISGHAIRVGSFFYGTNTDAALGDASVAPAIGLAPDDQVDVYQADDWLDDAFLRPSLSDVPATENNPVGNHSWISYPSDTSTPAGLNDLLRRLDFAAERDDHLPIAGVNNGAGTAMPYLLVSGYNGIAIGLTNGAHSSGSSPADLDGPGRVKPELVAPLDRTSWATGVVSSCAGLLISEAMATPALANATRAETVKAILLAAATKEEFPGWANTSTRPLDAHFGAGQVNVLRSHRVLVAGEVNSSNSELRPSTGWDYSDPLAPGSRKNYTFTIPAGCRAVEFSAVLTWHRQITGVVGSLLVAPAPELANLDLALYQSNNFVAGAQVGVSESGASDSPAHNVEHIYLGHLGAGQFTLRVTNAAADSFNTDYALAWLTSLGPADKPQLASTLANDGMVMTLSLSRLCPSLTYALEKSPDLASWTRVEIFTAAAESRVLSQQVAPGTQRLFHRLRWIE
ncbi:MAG: hypothetical protein ACR2OZ_13335 [Verrucomicrobiales bacterium]